MQRKVCSKTYLIKYWILSLSLIAETVNKIEQEGLPKYFNFKRKQIVSDLKFKLKLFYNQNFD